MQLTFWTTFIYTDTRTHARTHMGVSASHHMCSHCFHHEGSTSSCTTLCHWTGFSQWQKKKKTNEKIYRVLEEKKWRSKKEERDVKRRIEEKEEEEESLSSFIPGVGSSLHLFLIWSFGFLHMTNDQPQCCFIETRSTKSVFIYISRQLWNTTRKSFTQRTDLLQTFFFVFF